MEQKETRETRKDTMKIKKSSIKQSIIIGIIAALVVIGIGLLIKHLAGG